MPFATTWMDLGGTMLSEISQTEKDKYCMISLACGILKIQQTSEYNKTRNRLTIIVNKLVVTSVERVVGRRNTGVGD